MEEKKLKKKLKKIKENDDELIPQVNLDEITESMVFNIGNIDSELRDDLIYTTFYHWIIEKNYFSNKELNNILHNVLDDKHLFYKLGNCGDDTVFVRSFSALVVALLTARAKDDDYLSKEDSEYLKTRFFEYYNKEKDNRGYILGKGWAHSAAHGADVLDEFARSSFVDNDDLIIILKLLKEKTFTDTYAFVDEEDERMVTAAVRVIKREIITSEDIVNWIRSFVNFEMPDEYYVYHRLISNVKGFLRSLYFRIIEQKEDYSQIIKVLREVIDELNKFKNN